MQTIINIEVFKDVNIESVVVLREIAPQTDSIEYNLFFETWKMMNVWLKHSVNIEKTFSKY